MTVYLNTVYFKVLLLYFCIQHGWIVGLGHSNHFTEPFILFGTKVAIAFSTNKSFKDALKNVIRQVGSVRSSVLSPAEYFRVSGNPLADIPKLAFGRAVAGLPRQTGFMTLIFTFGRFMRR
jgi:hypothetical protein